MAITQLSVDTQWELHILKNFLTGLPLTTAPAESAIKITKEEKDGKSSTTFAVQLSKKGALKGAAIGGTIAGAPGAAAGAIIGALIDEAD